MKTQGTILAEIESDIHMTVKRRSYAYAGMIPLAKKLFKAGEPLAACIFMRGAIYYLMGKGNSRYYNDVHAHRRTLAEMAASVKDWETVEPQCSFDSDFAADFANRRTFWF